MLSDGKFDLGVHQTTAEGWKSQSSLIHPLLGPRLVFWSLITMLGICTIALLAFFWFFSNRGYATYGRYAYDTPFSGRRGDRSLSSYEAGSGPLEGSWQGVFSKSQEATLITAQKNATVFVGLLALKYSDGTVWITVNGRVNSSQDISLQETGVLEQPASHYWATGTDTGTFNASTSTLSGLGSDGANSYSWKLKRSNRVEDTVDVINSAAAEKMVGTWTGQFSQQTTTLTITHSTQNTFEGILTDVRGNKVRMAGEVLNHANFVRFHEIEVIQGVNWTLGAEVGKLASNCSNMAGNGNDAANPPYSWSFQRQ